jgi:hypothetical protein
MSLVLFRSAIAPDEGESQGDFVDVTMLPEGLLMPDSGGLLYINPDQFHDAFAQDVNSTDADIYKVKAEMKIHTT